MQPLLEPVASGLRDRGTDRQTTVKNVYLWNIDVAYLSAVPLFRGRHSEQISTKD